MSETYLYSSFVELLRPVRLLQLHLAAKQLLYLFISANRNFLLFILIFTKALHEHFSGIQLKQATTKFIPTFYRSSIQCYSPVRLVTVTNPD